MVQSRSAHSKPISVVIPVYRDWARLRTCLDALARQTVGPEAFEILLANNEPQAGCPLAALPANARLVDEHRPGSYAARNTAIATAAGRVLAFTDSDCVPDPHWLERALRLIEANPGARVTGPIPVFREPGSSYLAFVYDFHTAFKQAQAAAKGSCATANLVVERDVFDRVGPFNAALVSGGDTEWGERAHRAGVPLLYDEGVIVAHPARRTLAEIIRKKRRVAGSEAQRRSYPTFWYVLFKLLPPFHNYSRAVFSTRRGPVRPLDRFMLFFVHWAGSIVEAQEFLFVRRGWKRPNRS